MTIQKIIQKIENGQPCRVNFEKREVILDGFFIENIVFEMPENVEETLLKYYRNYKYSVPSRKADSKYFIALDESELSTKQLAENEFRYIARAKLELFVLGLIVNDKWDFGEKWYWQSKAEPKLILFRKWFEDHKEI